jgi:hypothetical protein
VKRILNEDLPRGAFAAIAIALPVGLALFHRELGHAGDIAFFRDWYLAFRESSAFYRDGPGLNYPIVGVLIVCAPARFAELFTGAPLDLASYTAVLKATLVAGEIASIFAASALARALDRSHPHAIAIALYALPSSWAGGAWFGQTDVWGTAFLLGAAAALVRFRRGGSVAAIAVGIGFFYAALLAKQLTFFAAPALALLAIFALRERRSRAAVALALSSPILLFAADPFLELPHGFRSHLFFVLFGGGSAHGELAVASGASLWSLFAPGGTPADQLSPLGISSFVWGLVLFAIANAMALAASWRAKWSDGSLVFLAGFGHLAMAVLLTGVHERYLAHAIPLLFLACDRRSEYVFTFIAGVWSGLFVLSTIHERALAIFARPEPLAVYLLVWLASLLFVRARARAEERVSCSA